MMKSYYYLKEIMRNWYLFHNDPIQNFICPQQDDSWNEFYTIVYDRFKSFLAEETMLLQPKVLDKFNDKFPFFFLNNDDKPMYLWCQHSKKYEEVVDNFNEQPNYYFLYVNRMRLSQEIKFIPYSLKSFSYSVLKNKYHQFKWNFFPKLNLAVAITEKEFPYTDNCPIHFMNIKSNGSMILAPYKNGKIITNVNHFLCDKNIAKKMIH